MALKPEKFARLRIKRTSKLRTLNILLLPISLHSKVRQHKEIQIILRLFLVIAMYCQASSSQFNQSLNLLHCQLAGKEAQVHAVGSNSLETTYILFELPYASICGLYICAKNDKPRLYPNLHSSTEVLNIIFVILTCSHLTIYFGKEKFRTLTSKKSSR